MKRKHQFFAALCLILFLNIIFTQYLVHQYYYENYVNVLIFCSLNLVLFPISLFIYKRDRKSEGVKKDE
ncbi:hypothetical protein [Bacillus sp. FJAT-50079]|uniref:hypothetical protein n=1 Tax=Bacillus sp. FJAT-50079 TaxID=2833577 RepID=UPI001BCA16B4|nr:hypothetical protein [Bacillus sp. FJAT-50079]MBS4209223.1 hypothetical protein [Bacillus sp. FJAT-50079]